MSDLTGTEVREWAMELEMDPAQQAMRQEMEARHNDLVQMNEVPDLPEWMTSGGDVVAQPSPMLGDLADVILSDMRPYQTDITCVPQGREYQSQSDEEEKWLALWWARGNDGWRVSRDVLWHSLLSHYVVGIVRQLPDVNLDAKGDPIKGRDGWVEYPWEILVPDPQTCFFPVTGAPTRPSVLARRYEMFVADIERDFGAVEGATHQDMRPVFKDGQWDFEKLSDDYVVGRMGNYVTATSRGEKCEFIDLYTKERTYCYALNKANEKGELLWSGPNNSGGVPAVVTSGLVTPQRKQSERLQPAFRAIYQCIKVINRIRAEISTRAENAKGDVVASRGPATIAAERESGAKSSITVQDDGAGPRVHMLNADHVQIWATMSDAALTASLEHWTNELQGYVNNWRQLSSPEVIKEARVSVYLSAVESSHRRQSTVLSNFDYMKRTFLEIAEENVKVLDRDFPLWATSEVRFGKGKKLGAGEMATINKAGVSYPHGISVSTMSTSESEQRARREDEQQKRVQGNGTLDDLISVDSDDLEERYKALAVDSMLMHTTTTFGATQIDQMVQDYLAITAGMFVPIAGAAPVGPPAGGTGVSPVRAPVTAPAAGGA